MAVTFLTNEDKHLIDVEIENLSKENERLSEEVNALKENGTGNGLTTEMVTALDNMFKVCAYSKEDISEEYGAFRKAFGLEEEPTSLVYELSEPVTLNGTSDFIDTGVKLYDTDKDFEIMLEFTEAVLNPEATILHCMYEANPWQGLTSKRNGASQLLTIVGTTLLQHGYVVNDVTRLVIAKIGGHYTAKVKHQGLIEPSLIIDGDAGYMKYDGNLLIGAYQDNSGNKGRWLNGTISQCKVYVGDLPSDEETNAFLMGE